MTDSYPERYLVVAQTTIRQTKIMLYIREGWVREMLVYTKPYDKAVYTKLRLHPRFFEIAPIELREWMKYNTVANESDARNVYITHSRTRRIDLD